MLVQDKERGTKRQTPRRQAFLRTLVRSLIMTTRAGVEQWFEPASPRVRLASRGPGQLRPCGAQLPGMTGGRWFVSSLLRAAGIDASEGSHARMSRSFAWRSA